MRPTRVDPNSPTYQVLADALLLEHSERCLVPSSMLEALVERYPEDWQPLVERMQRAIESAYNSGDLRRLRRVLRLCERTYRDLCRTFGLDPDTGTRLVKE